MLTREQFVALLRRSQNGKTAKQFAESLGCSEQYLSDIYHHRRVPGESIAKRMRFDRRIVFIPRGKTK